MNQVNSPRVSLVVPCRNEAKYIEECVQSLEALDVPEGGLEIVIADGMSDDGTREILSKLTEIYGNLRMVDNIKRITPCGLNAGITAARGEIVVRIDAHSTYAKDYVTQCVRVLEESGADVVGGPWVAEGKTYLQRAIAAAFASPLAMGSARGHDDAYEGYVDTVYLGCWRRPYLVQVGMFDEEFVRNQDDELNLRIIMQGGKVFQSPTIRSVYYPRNSLRLLWRQYFQYGYWKIRVMQKHGRPASLRHLIPVSFVAVLVALALLSPFLAFARIALLAILGFYVLALILAGILAGRRDPSLIPALPVVIGTFQLSYGTGQLAGVWDFLVRRKGGRFTTLTRQ